MADLPSRVAVNLNNHFDQPFTLRENVHAKVLSVSISMVSAETHQILSEIL
jgi:hypothetical protein